MGSFVSNATVEAGVRAGMVAGASFGVSPTMVCKQIRGTYNPATGTTGTPVETSVTTLLYGHESTTDDAGTPFEKQSAIVVISDLPNPLDDSDQFDDWGIQSFKRDPSNTFYEIELKR